jgi:hypothetical protein
VLVPCGASLTGLGAASWCLAKELWSLRTSIYQAGNFQGLPAEAKSEKRGTIGQTASAPAARGRAFTGAEKAVKSIS